MVDAFALNYTHFYKHNLNRGQSSINGLYRMALGNYILYELCISLLI